jgi:hypothetical protein
MNPQKQLYDHNKLFRLLFLNAERWWFASLICRFVAIFLGILAMWVTDLTAILPLTQFLFGGSAEGCLWKSDKEKSKAELLLRKKDCEDSFGWKITSSDISDLLAETSERILEKARIVNVKESYFTSKQEVGGKRALENLRESAQWSQHLARILGGYMFLTTILLVTVSLFVLIIAIIKSTSDDTLFKAMRITTATLMVLISLGFVRLITGYYSFSKKSEDVKKQAVNFLKSHHTEIDALKLFGEYHIYRSASPLLLEVIYNCNKAKLKELFKNTKE